MNRTVMDRTNQEWTITEGTAVVDASGDKVGKVAAAQTNYLIVRKGFFFPADYYIPSSAISNYDGDTVYLNGRGLRYDQRPGPQGGTERHPASGRWPRHRSRQAA